MADAYLPPGWPEAVRPLDSEDFEASAVAFLLELVPAYRRHPTVVRFPVILASIARHHLSGTVEGARQGYRTARSELGEEAPPHAVDATLKAYRDEGRRLAADLRAVGLVEQALRGEKFTQRL